MSSPYDMELIAEKFFEDYDREGTPEELDEFAVNYYSGRGDLLMDVMRDREAGP